MDGLGFLLSLPAWNRPVELPSQVLVDLDVKTLTTSNQGLHAREAFVHMDELSAARQTLEGAAVAQSGGGVGGIARGDTVRRVGGNEC